MSGKRKLSDAEALEAYNAYRYGFLNMHEIAEQYGVCSTTVEQLLKGVTYRHLHLKPVAGAPCCPALNSGRVLHFPGGRCV